MKKILIVLPIIALLLSGCLRVTTTNFETNRHFTCEEIEKDRDNCVREAVTGFQATNCYLRFNPYIENSCK